MHNDVMCPFPLTLLQTLSINTVRTGSSKPALTKVYILLTHILKWWAGFDVTVVVARQQDDGVIKAMN
jgi:hypothetical protein